MSVRENQSLQIALILFVMLTLILGVTTYLFFHHYQEEQLKTADLAAQVQHARTDQEQTVAAWATVCTFIAGRERIAADPSRVAVETDKLHQEFERDMAKYGPDLPPLDQNRTYPFLVESYATELGKKNNDYEATKEQLEILGKDFEAVQRANVQERQTYRAAMTRHNDDLANVRQTFNEDVLAKQQRMEKLAAAKDIAEQTLNDAQRTAAKQADQFRKQIDDLDKLIQQISKKVKQTELHNSPQGNVAVINQANRTATINLGGLDGLPKQTVFSVYGANDAATAKPKAQLEVIQIEAGHVATCRILSDDMKNLMMPGDWIYSPIWQPGEVEHYALAGYFDIDGDGRSDRQLLIDLIKARGGVVDAQLGEQGAIQGAITFETQYLIVADRIGTRAEKPEFLAGLARLLNTAEKLAVRPISVSKFLSHVGYTRERTVKGGGLVAWAR